VESSPVDDDSPEDANTRTPTFQELDATTPSSGTTQSCMPGLDGIIPELPLPAMVPLADLEAERARTARLSELLPRLASPASILRITLRDSEVQARACRSRIKGMCELEARLQTYIEGLRKMKEVRGLTDV